MGEIYTCKIENDFNGESRTIEKVSQEHLKRKNNIDVKAISIENSHKWPRIPLGIRAFFKNIEALEFDFTGLTEISSEDFDGLSQLKELILRGNKIHTIPEGLFEELPHLRTIDLSDNPIRHIGHNTFASLRELTKLSLQNTDCINEMASNKDKVKDLTFQLRIRCSPTDRMIEITEIAKSEPIKQAIDRRVNLIVFSFTKKVSQIETKVDSLIKRIMLIEQTEKNKSKRHTNHNTNARNRKNHEKRKVQESSNKHN